MVSLAFLAAQTRKIRLGTGILLLPQFDPLIAAKQLSSIDVLSQGRLIVGIGVGWSEHEYKVLRLSYHDRGRRADDYLRAMKALWSQDKPSYNGRFVSFDGLQANPRPVQQPHPPIVVGGRSEGSYRRSIEQGNGWFGYGLDLEETRGCLAALHQAAEKYSRPESLGPLEITVAPRVPVDKALAQQFSELGVHRLNLALPKDADTAAAERFIDDAARALV